MNQYFDHLNEYISVIIQRNGMDYVAANYIEIRNEYYIGKQT